VADTSFPIGRRIHLAGHFAEPVVLESVRPLGEGFECRVRLSDGSVDEAILSRDEGAAIFGQQADLPDSVQPVDAESMRLIVESSRIRLSASDGTSSGHYSAKYPATLASMLYNR
jgi:hypothetical protein